MSERTHKWTCGQCGDTYEATGVYGDLDVARWAREHKKQHRAAPKPIQLCPICEGCGTVPPDFYTRLGVSAGMARERCQTCKGDGIVYT